MRCVPSTFAGTPLFPVTGLHQALYQHLDSLETSHRLRGLQRHAGLSLLANRRT